MIKLNELSFSFGNQKVIDNLSLTINDGDFFVVVGPNGTGKSTLIKCLVGIYKVKHNQIQIDNECISCFDDYDQIGYVPQVKSKPSELPITAKEIFKLITKDSAKINEVSKLLNIETILNANINDLSGGQKQRINIAKALLLNIKYLILDEPTTGLDPKSRTELQEILQTLNERGVTIIVVSHYEHEVESMMTCKLDMETETFERIEKC
ncbi:ATP-binding cassette domain-containing protein [Mollicutes bacterium LVI A0078]|nr:ATP-binding cassette domain-containing protein [Mollicutes bacterium LVI A0075]WOO91816.1 ATP-binding cassette domain-containing protein [Mollicutes bacterium LVI A0078]